MGASLGWPSSFLCPGWQGSRFGGSLQLDFRAPSLDEQHKEMDKGPGQGPELASLAQPRWCLMSVLTQIKA
jgi:hypothetical protein